MGDGMIIRPSLETDAEALAAIYGHHVLHGTGTFEETPPSAEEMLARRAAVLGYGLPHLVAEEGGEVSGFAYAGPFRTRPAYRHTVEDSVYVAAGKMGRGIGKSLLGEVLARCEALGLRQVVALIGDSANLGSVGLHASLGFEHRATAPGVGFKQGRWLDVVWMQKALNGGSASLPDGPGLALG
jgi:phosphinothricin acetyltransferase